MLLFVFLMQFIIKLACRLWSIFVTLFKTNTCSMATILSPVMKWIVWLLHLVSQHNRHCLVAQCGDGIFFVSFFCVRLGLPLFCLTFNLSCQFIYMYGPHMWSLIILYWPPPPPPKLIHDNQISVLAGTVSRKIFNTRDSTVDSIPYDHDENKYQRRGAIDWFTRWFWWVLNPKWLHVIAANHLMSARSSVMNSLQCRHFLRARKCFCSLKRHVETEERRKWGESKGGMSDSSPPRQFAPDN